MFLRYRTNNRMIKTNRKGPRAGRISKFILVIGALAYGAAGSVARAQTADQLPAGRGKAEFVRICSQCHSINFATKLRMDSDGWAGIVDDMVSRGAEGSSDDFDLVASYLAGHFGPNNPIPGGAKPTAAAKVDINKATEKDLTTILGLTPADAQAIVHYRETSGNFTNWQDLQKVPHIDMKKLAAEKDRIEFPKAHVPAEDHPQK
jgi:competence ComEA-like helix-hairpin-helix protein